MFWTIILAATFGPMLLTGLALHALHWWQMRRFFLCSPKAYFGLLLCSVFWPFGLFRFWKSLSWKRGSP